MLEFQRKVGPFKIKEIWFSKEVYDVEGVDSVRFENTYFSGDLPGWNKEIQTTLILDLDKSLDDIWNGMDKKLCRHNITKALEDSSIAVRFNEKYDEFVEINRQFRKRKELPPCMISVDEMKKHYFLSTYEKNGVVLGGHLCLHDENRFEIFMACSSMTPESTFTRTDYGWGNRLSIWEMIKYAHQQGITGFDFGGYSPEATDEELVGINKFKLSFGGVVGQRYGYNKTYSKLFIAGNSLLVSSTKAMRKMRSLSWK